MAEDTSSESVDRIDDWNAMKSHLDGLNDVLFRNVKNPEKNAIPMWLEGRIIIFLSQEAFEDFLAKKS